jgi:hypothetical protein
MSAAGRERYVTMTTRTTPLYPQLMVAFSWREMNGAWCMPTRSKSNPARPKEQIRMEHTRQDNFQRTVTPWNRTTQSVH